MKNSEACHYAQPVFTRGAGLGNRLFQWARARAWCYEHHARMVAPIWLRFSCGHLWRQTVPLCDFPGRIALAGLFHADPDDLPAIASPWLHMRCRVIRETRNPSWDLSGNDRRVLRCFDGRDDTYSRLNHHQSRLRGDLLRIVSPRQRLRVNQLAVPPIGINIRLGKDFSPPPPPEHLTEGYAWVGWLQQTPISWFIETLELIRSHVGWCVPAVVVSDGSASQLRPLLEAPSVEWLTPSNAIVDLLLLSRTQLLLGSGSSTFSAWAAFLGQQPVFTAPGHPFTRLNLEPLAGQMISAFDPRRPDPNALGAMSAAVSDTDSNPSTSTVGR